MVSSRIRALSRILYDAIGWHWPGKHGEVSRGVLEHKPWSAATIRLPIRVEVLFHV
jgi:hypothetical protein